MSSAKKVGVIGWGNIGSGVVEVLQEKGVAGLELAKVCDIDLERERAVSLPKEYLTRDWQEIVGSPEIDIVVELVGGIEPARDIIVQSLKNGKDVVTANKMLLAQEGQEIFSLATSLKRRIG